MCPRDIQHLTEIAPLPSEHRLQHRPEELTIPLHLLPHQPSNTSAEKRQRSSALARDQDQNAFESLTQFNPYSYSLWALVIVHAGWLASSPHTAYPSGLWQHLLCGYWLWEKPHIWRIGRFGRCWQAGHCDQPFESVRTWPGMLFYFLSNFWLLIFCCRQSKLQQRVSKPLCLTKTQ